MHLIRAMERHLAKLKKIATIIPFLILIASCIQKQENHKKRAQAESTRKMVEKLNEIAENALPQFNYTLNKERAAYHLRMHRQFGTPINDEYLLKYVNELIFAGENQKAINILEERIKQRGFDTISKLNRKLHYPHFSTLGMAYIQMAEDENCVMSASSQVCILPITGNGIHSKTSWSEKAIFVFGKILESFPDDLQAKWMYNLSHMTLGSYPHEVPDEHLIAGVYDNKDKFPFFKNIARKLEVDVLGLAGGVCVEDFDNDGDMDLMVSSYGLRDQIRYFEQIDGTFKDRTKNAGLEGIVSGLNMVHADYDNDGLTDVLVLRGAWFKDHGKHPNSLLKNLGDGFFEDITETAGILSFYPTQTASWADFDLDGDLDLFVGNETSDSRGFPCEFYQNNGDGTFTEVAKKYGIQAHGYFKAAIWGDINNDQYPDLFLSNYYGRNKLYLNVADDNGDRTFEEIGKNAGVEEPFQSFPAWFFDYNNDGFEDIFISGYDQDRISMITVDEALQSMGMESPASKPRLYKNNGDLTFTDVTKSTGLDRVVYTMGSNFGDLDNDGWLDFYLGTGTPDLNSIVPNRMYHNHKGTGFEDVTNSGGFGHLQKGHGVAFTDFDNDGDQDIYTVLGGAVSGDTFHNALFENPGFENNWIHLTLKGTSSNASAIGAKISIKIVDENRHPREIHRTISTGGSFGAASLRQEIGLGKASLIEELTIYWPNMEHAVSKWTNVKVNNSYIVKEGVQELNKI